MKELSDEDLIREVQGGSITAFEFLVRRYQGKLHSFVSWIVRDSEIAQDVVQETFIRMYKSIDRVDPRRKFSSLLYVSARNTAISALRAKVTHAPLEFAVEAQTSETPESRLELKDEQQLVLHALDSIDRKFKRVITLYYFDDLSYQEIAKQLHLPVNTVRTHLKRAKEALRKKLM